MTEAEKLRQQFENLLNELRTAKGYGKPKGSPFATTLKTIDKGAGAMQQLPFIERLIDKLINVALTQQKQILQLEKRIKVLEDIKPKKDTDFNISP